MASPNTLTRRAATPGRSLGQYVCVVCRQQRQLFRLKPHKVYACATCIVLHGGPSALFAHLRKVDPVWVVM